MPEIEKEVKRLLRVDNEAVNVKWEIVECEEAEPEKDSGRDTPKGKKGAAGKGKANKVQSQSVPVDEHHIFGEEVSDSEEEDVNVTARDLDVDDTRLSEDSRSRFSDSNSMMQGMAASSSRLMTEFKRNMFDAGPSTSSQHHDEESSDFIDSKDLNDSARIGDIRRELYDLHNQQNKVEQEIQTIDNKKLKERLQEDLDKLIGKIIMKDMELDELLAHTQI